MSGQKEKAGKARHSVDTESHIPLHMHSPVDINRQQVPMTDSTAYINSFFIPQQPRLVNDGRGGKWAEMGVTDKQKSEKTRERIERQCAPQGLKPRHITRGAASFPGSAAQKARQRWPRQSPRGTAHSPAQRQRKPGKEGRGSPPRHGTFSRAAARKARKRGPRQSPAARRILPRGGKSKS